MLINFSSGELQDAKMSEAFPSQYLYIVNEFAFE